MHDLGNLLGYIIDRWHFVIGHSENLRVNSGLVNQLPSISTQSSKGTNDMLINKRDLVQSPVLLKLLGSLLLDGQDHKVLALDPNRNITLVTLPT